MKPIVCVVRNIFIATLLLASSVVIVKAQDKAFIHPPDSVRISCYWYWISGNISKEGVIKDLYAMKEAGIGRAFIGNIGLPSNEAPEGPVKLFTEEWYDIMHTAMKTAAELDIEIGVFNCPGWSQAGGPWIKPEESMRYLATTATEVTGGKRITEVLPRPDASFFQDVKVLAYPARQLSKLTLEDASSRDSITATFTMLQPFMLRSIRVFPAHHPVSGKIQVQVMNNGKYDVISDFEVNRTNSSLSVGFDPYAPIAVSIPPQKCNSSIRLVFEKMNVDVDIKEIEILSQPLVERYPEKSLAKMHQTPLPYWKDYKWREAVETDDASLVVQPDRVLDITSCLRNDTLTWAAPSGKWIVLRTGMVPTGVKNGPALSEGTGLEVDKWNTEHLAVHYDSFIGKLCRRIPPHDRKTWKKVVADSYEKGGQNFSDHFFAGFQQKYGYDPTPFLPVFSGVVVANQDLSNRFLWDVRRMMADFLSYNHIGALRELAHKDGFTIWLENYGHWGFPGEFLQYGGQSDDVSGEFWSEGHLGDIENRAASSCAHIYGKQKVYSESFTCGGAAFSRYPATMKQRGDKFFAEGVNSTLLHVYISQEESGLQPGLNAPFGNEFNRNNTWFSQLGSFTDYLRRCNFMLQQGLYIADVAYFIGEDAPVMTGVTDPAMPEGYQFDYINAEVIMRDMFVRNGLLTLPHGTQYKVLVLPQLETMRPELLSRIKQLVLDGAVILGPAPKRSPSMQNYPEADEQVRSMATELWGTASLGKRMVQVGKGKIFTGYAMTEVLAAIHCEPDCRIDGTTSVVYAHRATEDLNVYFLANQSDQQIKFTSTFRLTGFCPEVWLPSSGEIRSLPAYTFGEKTTRVPLQLEPFESVFVVFRKKTNKQGKIGLIHNFPNLKEIDCLSKPWDVCFQSISGRGKHLKLDSLEDWTMNLNDSIRYYSGEATYSNNFILADNQLSGQRIYVDLGCVVAMAKVKVNGKDVGGLWTPPYCIDITDYVRQGQNMLEVVVVNTWMNRLIGDTFLPENKRRTWTFINPYKRNSKLQPSGLIGPVRILSK